MKQFLTIYLLLFLFIKSACGQTKDVFTNNKWNALKSKMELNTQYLFDMAEQAKTFFIANRTMLDSMQKLSVEFYMLIDTVQKFSTEKISEINSLMSIFNRYSNSLLLLIKSAPKIIDDFFDTRIWAYEKLVEEIKFATKECNKSCVLTRQSSLRILN